MKITRRRLVQAGLISAASLPLVRALGGSVARAADPALNFVCIYAPHGVSAEFWAQRGSDTATTFDIAYENCSLQPFDDAKTYGKSFKDKILIIEGLDHLSNANGHDSAGTVVEGRCLPLPATTGQLHAEARRERHVAVRHACRLLHG